MVVVAVHMEAGKIRLRAEDGWLGVREPCGGRWWAMAAYRGLGSRGTFRAWRLYEPPLRAAWAGQVPQVQTLLREQLERLGPPPARAPADHPSKVVSFVLKHITDNAGRLDCPRYRREGLPVTSHRLWSTKADASR